MFYGSVEILFSVACLSSTKDRRVTTSLPQRGRQPKGSIPLTPSSFLINLLTAIATLGDARAAGWKHDVL